MAPDTIKSPPPQAAAKPANSAADWSDDDKRRFPPKYRGPGSYTDYYGGEYYYGAPQGPPVRRPGHPRDSASMHTPPYGPPSTMPRATPAPPSSAAGGPPYPGPYRHDNEYGDDYYYRAHPRGAPLGENGMEVPLRVASGAAGAPIVASPRTRTPNEPFSGVKRMPPPPADYKPPVDSAQGAPLQYSGSQATASTASSGAHSAASSQMAATSPTDTHPRAGPEYRPRPIVPPKRFERPMPYAPKDAKDSAVTPTLSSPISPPPGAYPPNRSPVLSGRPPLRLPPKGAVAAGSLPPAPPSAQPLRPGAVPPPRAPSSSLNGVAPAGSGPPTTKLGPSPPPPQPHTLPRRGDLPPRPHLKIASATPPVAPDHELITPRDSQPPSPSKQRFMPHADYYYGPYGPPPYAGAASQKGHGPPPPPPPGAPLGSPYAYYDADRKRLPPPSSMAPPMMHPHPAKRPHPASARPGTGAPPPKRQPTQLFTSADMRKAFVRPPLVSVYNEPAMDKHQHLAASEAPSLGRFLYNPLAPVTPIDPRLLQDSAGAVFRVVVPIPVLGYGRWEVGDPALYEGAEIGAHSASPSPSSAASASPPPNWCIYDLPSIAQRRVWGTDVYTDDSDILGMCLHSGWLRINVDEHTRQASPHVCLVVSVRILPALVRYQGCSRQGLRSRNWGNSHDGVSLKIDSVVLSSDRRLCQPTGAAARKRFYFDRPDTTLPAIKVNAYNNLR